MKTSRILLDAADYIEQNGWLQGQYGRMAVKPGSGSTYYPEGCAACAIGAINIVQGLTPPVFPDSTKQIAKMVVRILHREGQVGSLHPYHLEEWNDEEGRTQAEVVALLRRAAKVAG